MLFSNMSHSVPLHIERHHFFEATSFRMALSTLVSASKLLQLGVLVFQSIQLAGIGYLHAAELRLVFLKGSLRYPVLTAYIRRPKAVLQLIQYSDDLLIRET